MNKFKKNVLIVLAIVGLTYSVKTNAQTVAFGSTMQDVINDLGYNYEESMTDDGIIYLSYGFEQYSESLQQYIECFIVVYFIEVDRQYLYFQKKVLLPAKDAYDYIKSYNKIYTNIGSLRWKDYSSNVIYGVEFNEDGDIGIVTSCIDLYDIDEAYNSYSNRLYMKTYINKSSTPFSMSYPSDWEVQENPNQTVKVQILAPMQNNLRTNINVSSLKNYNSLERLFQMQQEVNSRHGYLFEKKEYININGMTGLKITSSFTFDGIRAKSFQYILKATDYKQYIITATVPLSFYEKDIKLVENIIQSFESL